MIVVCFTHRIHVSEVSSVHPQGCLSSSTASGLRQKNATDTERRYQTYMQTKKRVRVAFAVPSFTNNRSPTMATLAGVRGTSKAQRVTAGLDYFLILDALTATQSRRSESEKIPIQTVAKMRRPILSGQNGLHSDEREKVPHDFHSQI